MNIVIQNISEFLLFLKHIFSWMEKDNEKKMCLMRQLLIRAQKERINGGKGTKKAGTRGFAVQIVMKVGLPCNVTWKSEGESQGRRLERAFQVAESATILAPRRQSPGLGLRTASRLMGRLPGGDVGPHLPVTDRPSWTRVKK